MQSNPVDSPTFFMLMIQPAGKKIPFTSWNSSLVEFTHPREEEEVDYTFVWRFDHERSIMSTERKRKIKSKHIFRDPPILYQKSR